ncbi:methyl-accepting chemotaxis protein [Shewanella sp. SR41-2]|nr:methyl-accepting chemotaxis protein [Shewanella sp. SR41-2]
MKGSGGFDDAAADLAENLDQLAQELDQQFITTVKETLNATTTSARVQLWVSISIGLFIVIIMMVLYQHILTLLKKLDDSMRNLASGAKDLTSRLDYFGNNEIAKVASSFNAFVGNIGELITDFNQNSQQLGTASNQLALTSNKTLNGMQRRQSETEQVGYRNESNASNRH